MNRSTPPTGASREWGWHRLCHSDPQQADVIRGYAQQFGLTPERFLAYSETHSLDHPTLARMLLVEQLLHQAQSSATDADKLTHALARLERAGQEHAAETTFRAAAASLMAEARAAVADVAKGDWRDFESHMRTAKQTAIERGLNQLAQKLDRAIEETKIPLNVWQLSNFQRTGGRYAASVPDRAARFVGTLSTSPRIISFENALRDDPILRFLLDDKGYRSAAMRAKMAVTAGVVALDPEILERSITRDKSGAITKLTLSQQEVIDVNSTVLLLPRSELVKLRDKPLVADIYRFTLMQEIHDLQVVRGDKLGTDLTERDHLWQLRKAINVLTPLSYDAPSKPTEPQLILTGSDRSATPLLKLPQWRLPTDIIQLPTVTPGGLFGLEPTGARSTNYGRGPASLLLLRQHKPFWVPRGASTWEPGEPFFWSVKGAPDTATLVIPDIHGHLHLLENLLTTGLDTLSKRSETQKRIVFLGDYINKGDESAQVIERVLRLARETGLEVIFLRGNHEGSYTQDLFASPKIQPVNVDYMKQAYHMLGTCGFDLTVRSYQLLHEQKNPGAPAMPLLIRNFRQPPNPAAVLVGEPTVYENTVAYKKLKNWYETFQAYFFSIVPEEHQRFYRDLQLTYQAAGSDYLYSHSSGNPNRPRGLAFQTPEDIMWSRIYERPANAPRDAGLSDYYVMAGHSMGHLTVQAPEEGTGILDTGTFPKASMFGALITPDMQYVIAAPQGGPNWVMPVIDAIEQRLVDVKPSKGNSIPNVRRRQ